jgi:hypothetical protein
MQYLQRPFSVIPQRIHPYEHYICSSQYSVDVTTKQRRFLQFARTSAIDPTTETKYKDPTQLGRNVNISASQTAIITQQLVKIRAQF